jgi:uncharacterized 2Fe-2S/4Fe-4S cluster protein (DUF4445 family)
VTVARDGVDRVQVELVPLGVRLTIPRGAPLEDVLFDHGVEFPCGGRGRCRGCRVRVLAGDAPADDAQRALLSADEIAGGWRLACRCRAESDLTLELDQWQAPVLADHSPFAFTPREGLGVAVDLGTTTIVAQFLDLSTARVIAVRSGLNAQARYGADVMSRIEGALGAAGAELRRLVRQQIGALVEELLGEACADPQALRRVVLVGNSAMHHLFCGIDVAPLAALPFEPTDAGPRRLDARDLGWTVPTEAEIVFLPCLGGFVGSDVLAGIRATRLDRSSELVGLMDLGTNGEVVVGTREGLLCASTAAGPAFEGARISCGMRAATGAISAVTRVGQELQVHVIGGGAARGVCGSGLVDAVAAGLDLGHIERSGRLAGGAKAIALGPSVEVTQRDVREVQLAKGAIAAGLHLLLERLGAGPQDLQRLYLAGAFGNYIDRESARRIGLLDAALERIEPAGNAALLGAKLALFDSEWEYADLRGRITHVSLNAHPDFQERFAREMAFP